MRSGGGGADIRYGLFCIWHPQTITLDIGWRPRWLRLVEAWSTYLNHHTAFAMKFFMTAHAYAHQRISAIARIRLARSFVHAISASVMHDRGTKARIASSSLHPHRVQQCETGSNS